MPRDDIVLGVRAEMDGSVPKAQKQIESVGESAEQTKEQLQELDESVQTVGEDFENAGEQAEEADESIAGSGSSANKAAGFFQKLGKSLKRIFLYRMIRKVLSEIGQAAKEGLSNLYDYSAALGSIDSTRAKTNMDSLATSALFVKNSLGAMLGPVIQAITPIVYQLANAFSVAANAINQLFAALLGNASFTRAVRFPTEMKKGLAGASGAAKELKRTLLGFDEINRLDAPDTGGGGGGASGLDASEMFEEAEVSSKYQKIAQIVKKLAPLVAAVGAGFAAWKIGSGLVSVLSKIPKGAVKVAVAIGLVVLAVDQLKGAFEKLNNGDFSFSTIIQGLSGIALGVGAVFLLFGGPAAAVVAAIGTIIFAVKSWTEAIKSGAISWEGLKIAIDWTIKNAKDTISGWVTNTKQKFSDLWSNIQGGFDKFKTKLTTGWTNFTDGLKSGIEKLMTPIRNIAQAIDNLFNTNFSAKFNVSETSATVNLAKTVISASGKKMQTFASGGFPTTGELFIARENGIPEMVGQIGGQNAVANNDQIVTAIEQGVYRAMSQSGQNINVNVDGKSLFDIIVNRNNSQVRTSGKSPLLV